MNIRVDDTLAFAKFGIGQPVKRAEDPVLVRGEGRYTDDIDLPGQLHATFVRSSYAHGHLRGVDTEAARAMPGVRAVYTATDLASFGYKPTSSPMDLTNRDGTKSNKPSRPHLATDRVRFVGDTIACVVAETAAQAQDAAEAVEIDIEPLPSVTEGEAALAPGAPQLFDEVPGNLLLDFSTGDAAAVDEAMRGAAHVTKLRIANNRIIVNPMEPRVAIGSYDPDSGRYTFRAGTQGVFGQRNMLAAALGVSVDKLRVLTSNVGGSFGMKAIVFPEYVCLLHAARELGAPVKWLDRRSDSFMSDTHGRDHVVEAELALDAEGIFLGIRVRVVANIGAYLTPHSPHIAINNIPRHFNSVYRTPAIAAEVRIAFSNTAPIGAYRGAGRPEGNFFMERLVDNAAAEMGIDRLELRRRNHIDPSQMPYKTPLGMTYDSGEFGALLEETVTRADWHGFAARREASAGRGLLRGLGIGQYLEITAPPTSEAGNLVFGDDGTVTIVTGTLDYGQGHWSALAQILVDRLGVPFEAVRLMQGDSDLLQAGGGTGGSKSIMASGAAVIEASALVIEKGKIAAGHLLEAAAADIEFSRGRFTIAGTDRSIGIMQLARTIKTGGPLPDGVPDSLDVTHTHKASPSAFPNGCHIAEVEIDPDTGLVQVVRYTALSDFGVQVNPMLVEGQLHGGVTQGIGQALFERTVYDGEGQMLTGSFMDYALPRADAVPDFAVFDRGVPATTNPLGAKGCGEAGCAGSLPAVMNAVVDALRARGIHHVDMPATPEKIWRLLNR